MSSTHPTCAGSRALLVLTIMLLTACSGGSSSEPAVAAEAIDLAGSVGDGPVVNADLTFFDADGETVGSTSSDQQANYQFTIPQGTRLPVRIRANGGTDLVTGRALDFEMVGVLGEDATAGRSTLNISPLSTMTVRAMECTDRRFNAGQLRNMWKRIQDQVGMGLDPEVLSDPLFSQIGDESVAEIVLASEALAEAVRRTSAALSGAGLATTPEEVFGTIACDLAADGLLDGRGRDVAVRTAAVFRATSAAVALEMVAGELRVDEQVATPLMNAAIEQIQPSAAGRSVTEVRVSPVLQTQIVNDLLFLQEQFDDPQLLDLAAALAEAQPDDLATTAAQVLTTNRREALLSTATQLAYAEETMLAQVEDGLAQQQNQSAPFVSFFASESRVVVGDPVQLSWASSSADQCLASEGWSGVQDLEGTVAIGELMQTTQFVLTCFSSGGTNRSVLEVVVIDRNGTEQAPEPEMQPEPQPEPAPEPEPEPEPEVQPEPDLPPTNGPATVSVTLSASAGAVRSGEFVQLNWSSANAEQCVASGGWEGNRSESGSAEIGPLNATSSFTLSCSNAGGTDSAVVVVEVQGDGTLALAWEAPTENSDGSALAGLSGYRVYYGTASGRYDGILTVSDGQTTSASLALPLDTYYVAMTAVDLDGVESAMSNEIVKASR